MAVVVSKDKNKQMTSSYNIQSHKNTKRLHRRLSCLYNPLWLVMPLKYLGLCDTCETCVMASVEMYVVE